MKKPSMATATIEEGAAEGTDLAEPLLAKGSADGARVNGEAAGDELLSTGMLAAVTLVAAGVQFGWALQLSLLTPYVQELGIPHRWASLIWLCGPISGLLVQPVIGVWSDNCYSKWGPRRPFILVGTVLIILSMLTIGFSADLGYWIGDQYVVRSDGIRPYACIVFVTGFWMLDLANNTLQGPCRALVADLAGESQRTAGNAFFSMWMALGNVLGYSTGASGAASNFFPAWLMHTSACGGACANLKAAFLLAIIFLFVTMVVTVCLAKEQQLEAEESQEEEEEEEEVKVQLPPQSSLGTEGQKLLVNGKEIGQLLPPSPLGRRWSIGTSTPARAASPYGPPSPGDSIQLAEEHMVVQRQRRRSTGVLERLGSGGPEFFSSYQPRARKRPQLPRMRRSQSAAALLQRNFNLEAGTTSVVAYAGQVVNKAVGKATSAAKVAGEKVSRSCASLCAPLLNVASEIGEGVRTLPQPNKMVMVVMALTWTAWFPFLLFDTDWMGREVFHGEPGGGHAAAAALYVLGVRQGALGLLLNSIVQGVTSLQVEGLCRRFGSKWVWAGSNLTIAACLGSTWLVSRAADNLLPFGPSGFHVSPHTTQTAAVAIFAILGAPLAVTYSVPYSMTSILTANDGGGQGLAMGVLNLAIVMPQVVISLGAGPFDALFGGGNEPAFVAAALFAFAAGICAALLLPRRVFDIPTDKDGLDSDEAIDGRPI